LKDLYVAHLILPANNTSIKLMLNDMSTCSTKNGGGGLFLHLGDRTGTIKASKWEFDNIEAAEAGKSRYKIGRIYEVKGSVYKDK